jgi:hypothetical protein
VQFNTGQMQELTGIRREQFRHWRKVLPPLAGRDGRADLYDFAEVLALAVIAIIVDRMGVSVSRLTSGATEIFAFFAEQEDMTALPSLLHFTERGVLVPGDEPDCDAFLSVRVDHVFARLRERLAPEQRRQLSLPLRG